MTDRKLLELAAKAAGINHSGPIGETRLWIEPYDRQDAMHPLWNPLTDDGDALRLAVKLNISPIMRVVGCDATTFGDACAYERWGDDRNAATRRAIVRAAAAIGKTMK